jgi:hypothetical protein
MSSHDPFGHLKHKLWPKKGSKSNCQFDFRPLKVENRPNFLTCRWHVINHWKFFDEDYNFASELNSIECLHAKLKAPKIARISVVGISRLPLGGPRTKWHLGVGPMAKHRVYYKGEGGGFPQVRAVVSLMSPCLPVTFLCTKVLQLHTNQLVVWFVQVHVSKWSACQYA